MFMLLKFLHDLLSCVLTVLIFDFLQANFALAKNEHIRRRRPIVVETTAQDNDERQFGDQIAAESIASASSHNVVEPPNYPANFFTG